MELALKQKAAFRIGTVVCIRDYEALPYLANNGAETGLSRSL